MLVLNRIHVSRSLIRYTRWVSGRVIRGWVCGLTLRVSLFLRPPPHIPITGSYNNRLTYFRFGACVVFGNIIISCAYGPPTNQSNNCACVPEGKSKFTSTRTTTEECDDASNDAHISIQCEGAAGGKDLIWKKNHRRQRWQQHATNSPFMFRKNCQSLESGKSTTRLCSMCRWNEISRFYLIMYISSPSYCYCPYGMSPFVLFCVPLLGLVPSWSLSPDCISNIGSKQPGYYYPWCPVCLSHSFAPSPSEWMAAKAIFSTCLL